MWGIQNHFQIVVRLQLVRRMVHDVVSSDCSWEFKCKEMQDILIAIQAVAEGARTAGLGGFTSTCLHLCERIEPLIRDGYLPSALVAEWAAIAELYLRRPRDLGFATALLELLNDPQWHNELDSVEQASLLHELLEPSS